MEWSILNSAKRVESNSGKNRQKKRSRNMKLHNRIERSNVGEGEKVKDKWTVKYQQIDITEL